MRGGYSPRLPDEMIEQIGEYLPAKDIARAQQVNRRLKRVHQSQNERHILGERLRGKPRTDPLLGYILRDGDCNLFAGESEAYVLEWIASECPAIFHEDGEDVYVRLIAYFFNSFVCKESESEWNKSISQVSRYVSAFFKAARKLRWRESTLRTKFRQQFHELLMIHLNNLAVEKDMYVEIGLNDVDHEWFARNIYRTTIDAQVLAATDDREGELEVL